MATRWAYEALTVEQFKRNRFEKPFFKFDMDISQNDWYASFLVPSLKIIASEPVSTIMQPGRKNYYDFQKLAYHLNELVEYSGVMPGSWINKFNSGEYDENIAGNIRTYLDSLRGVFRQKSNIATKEKDLLYKQMAGQMGELRFMIMRSRNYNENLANIVLNRLSAIKIYDTGRRLIQKADPVFMKPGSKYGRAHFFAPYKQLGSLKIDTLIFNVVVLWLMSGFLFIALYYNWLKRLVKFIETLRLPFLKKFGREFLPW
jgi:hypothetical protein